MTANVVLRRPVAVVALLSALTLSGCGKKSPPAPAANDDGAPVTYPKSDYVVSGPGRSGGTLRVSEASDNATLDLQVITGVNPKWLGRLLFDNLVYLDDKGNATPWLARSWEISPDGKTYTFRLRDDVTFSDGTPFDAEVVKVNLDRMRDPATRTGMTTAYIAPYARGVVVDKYTFRAELATPYTPFLTVLAQSWLGMYSAKAIRENPKSLADHPVGSGPFVLERYERQKGLTLVKRPDYRWAPDFVGLKGPAHLDRIEIETVPEAIVRYESLLSGRYDLTVDAPAQNAAAFRSNPDFVLHSRVNLGNPVRFTFNVEKPPFDDVRVRRAVTLATDRAGLARLAGFGEYRAKGDFLSAVTPYYDPSFRDALKTDFSKAGTLLDEAGWTGRDAAGFRTKAGIRLAAGIIATDGPAYPEVVLVALKSDLKKIGLDLTLIRVPATRATDLRRSGDYQALGAGYWHTNTPDGLFIVYHGSNFGREFTGQNSSRIRDAALDELLSQARATRDPAELRRLYSAAQKRLTEIVPADPIYENHTLVAHRRDVKGVVFDTSHNTVYFPAVWLDR